MFESHSWKNKTVTKMWTLICWWYLSKHLTITITSLILVTFLAVLSSCKRIWIWDLDRNLMMAIYKVLFGKLYTILTFIRFQRFWWVLFQSCLWIRGAKKSPLPKICLIYPARWHLSQWYLTQRRSKKYINHEKHHLSSAENQQILLYQEI